MCSDYCFLPLFFAEACNSAVWHTVTFWDELLQLQEKFLGHSLQQCGLQCKLAKELIPYSAAMMSAVPCELCVLAPAFTVVAHTLLP